MTTVLCVLDHQGDTEIKWDHNNPDEVESARKIVHNLRLQGYSFFLVDGRPADEITAGGGTLIVRKLTADEVLAPLQSEPEESEPFAAPDQSTKPRKGRKGVPNKQVVATRPIAGG